MALRESHRLGRESERVLRALRGAFVIATFACDGFKTSRHFAFSNESTERHCAGQKNEGHLPFGNFEFACQPECHEEINKVKKAVKCSHNVHDSRTVCRKLKWYADEHQDDQENGGGKSHHPVLHQQAVADGRVRR